MRPLMIFAAFLLLSQVSVFAVDGPRQSTKVPRFDVAVDKGLAYLQAAVAKTEQHDGHLTLAAYAMLKCGIPQTDPFVAHAIEESIASRISIKKNIIDQKGAPAIVVTANG